MKKKVNMDLDLRRFGKNQYTKAASSGSGSSDIVLETLNIDMVQGEQSKSRTASTGNAWDKVNVAIQGVVIDYYSISDIAYKGITVIFDISEDGEYYIPYGDAQDEVPFEPDSWYLLDKPIGDNYPNCDTLLDFGEYGVLFKTYPGE